MTPWEQLRDDPRTWFAIDSLLDRGLCEEYVFPLLQHLSILPELWRGFDSETPRERKDRRHALASKMRQLALAIESDTEAKHYRIFDHQSITTTPLQDRITVSDFLKELAGNCEAAGLTDAHDDSIPETRSTRNTLKAFVQREVAARLYELLGQPKRKPILATVLLCNAILQPIDGEEVTSEQIKSVYRTISKG